jgi:hypothetical protein
MVKVRENLVSGEFLIKILEYVQLMKLLSIILMR